MKLDWLHTGKLVLITGLTQAPLSGLGPGAASRLSDTFAVAARDFFLRRRFEQTPSPDPEIWPSFEGQR